ncbi:unnamed protein product [Didymodactylos carnosus]|uniref:Helix-turn-helix domain-containing protein n=1 Tax=Didymodactylos carnosus TaxID=1234261 RepID=A0A8S2PRW7_9BILA|nr:unnamed protein product [Didymodactylos carnosus]CAF4067159.1 unnamed protein product [Didymodactylos carnosus]
MRSPLAPILVDIFMNNLEKKHIEPLTSSKIIPWVRYVDDMFVIMTFLDVLIRKTDKKYDTTIFRKHTNTFLNTNLYLKWNGCLPRYQKIDLINSLVVRALRICSNNVLLNDELKFLRDVLNANGYPIKLIKRTTKHTIHKEKKRSTK